MYPVSVIPARSWKHLQSGHTASLHGAVPYSSEADRDEWEIVQTGWTVVNDNGTIGIGQKPWATREEAEAYMARKQAERESRKIGSV
jgi:hypothetical protein